MNKFITAVTKLDAVAVKDFLQQPKWRDWVKPSGKSAFSLSL
jgi:hypothetical protein